MIIIRRRFTVKKREQARSFVENRIKYFNSFYNFKLNKSQLTFKKNLEVNFIWTKL